MATPKGYRNVEAPGQPEVMAPGIADSMGMRLGSQPMLLPPPPGQPMGQPMGQPSGIASAYMNPYLREALDPQLKELQRQQAIRRVDNAGRLTKAGAYGGGRQAIMESELNRAYLDKAADVTGRGYAAAFDKGREQFNREQDLGLRAQDLTNRYGLDALRQQLLAGSTQQDITAEGIAADKKQFSILSKIAGGIGGILGNVKQKAKKNFTVTGVVQNSAGKKIKKVNLLLIKKRVKLKQK